MTGNDWSCTIVFPYNVVISGMRDSNSRPLGPKPSALAIWANPRLYLQLDCMVGIGRLELPTSSLSETRSNQLSYMPATL